MEEHGRLQSMGSQRVRHNWATSLSLFTFHFLFSLKCFLYVCMYVYMCVYIYIYIYFFFKILILFIWLWHVLLWHEGFLAVACGIQSPDQILNPRLLYWECGVLATGPLGKSLKWFLYCTIVLTEFPPVHKMLLHLYGILLLCCP